MVRCLSIWFLPFICVVIFEIFFLYFLSDDQLNEHLNGKRHKKFESLREERLNSAKRSVFVSNLNKHTFVKHLEEHFVQFGKLVKVVNDHQKVKTRLLSSFIVCGFFSGAFSNQNLKKRAIKYIGKEIRFEIFRE